MSYELNASWVLAFREIGWVGGLELGYGHGSPMMGFSQHGSGVYMRMFPRTGHVIAKVSACFSDSCTGRCGITL